MAKVIDEFTIGGIGSRPSLPGDKLQRLLGSRIRIDVAAQELIVPTKSGVVIARRGDRIVLYDDGTLDALKG